MDNLAFALKIAGIVKDYESEHGRDVSYLAYELVDFHSSRPGHDLRYALDGTKLKDIGFSYPVTFEESLRETIYWTLDHRDQWL
jgi:dTDP-D-glucose 4,6-dehydratase